MQRLIADFPLSAFLILNGETPLGTNSSVDGTLRWVYERSEKVAGLVRKFAESPGAQGLCQGSMRLGSARM